MSSSSGSDAFYGVLFIGLIVASQLDRLGLFSGGGEASSAQAEMRYHRIHHHAMRVPLPSPSPIPIAPDSASWLPGWLIWVLVIAGTVAVVVTVYIVLSNIREDTKERCLALERSLKKHEEWIEEHEWISPCFKSLMQQVQEDRAELQSHRKMLKILKQMPTYQVQAATMIVSTAVVDPQAAREARQQLTTSPSSASEWERDGEVLDGA